jgi:hypothetical protein
MVLPLCYLAQDLGVVVTLPAVTGSVAPAYLAEIDSDDLSKDPTEMVTALGVWVVDDSSTNGWGSHYYCLAGQVESEYNIMGVKYHRNTMSSEYIIIGIQYQRNTISSEHNIFGIEYHWNTTSSEANFKESEYNTIQYNTT